MYKIIQNDKVIDVVQYHKFVRFLPTGHVAMTDRSSAQGIVGSDNKTLYSYRFGNDFCIYPDLFSFDGGQLRKKFVFRLFIAFDDMWGYYCLLFNKLQNFIKETGDVTCFQNSKYCYGKFADSVYFLCLVFGVRRFADFVRTGIFDVCGNQFIVAV
jgi:hypothetical protein